MSQLQDYVDTQVAEILPLKKISLEIAERASRVIVTDAATLKVALDIRKEITRHATAVKNARLDITRQFDDVKSQFIAGESDILEPTEKAKTAISEKIMDYEAEQEKIRKTEQDRVDAITAKFATNVRQYRTLKAIDERGAELKTVFSKLPQEDQDNPAIKLAFTQVVNELLARKDEIRTAEVDAAEQAKIAAKRRVDLAQAEAEAARAEKSATSSQKQAPKTGLKTVTKFTIVDAGAIPREFCTPSEQLIREAIKNGLAEIPGVSITQERSF